MKLAAVVISLLLFSGASFASGQRDIKPSQILEQDSAERSLEQLDARASYLGSNSDWHLFARTFTEASGGLPYSHTEAYRVKAGKTEVLNGWSLTDIELEQNLSPQNCPRPLAIDHARSRIVIRDAVDLKARCIPAFSANE